MEKIAYEALGRLSQSEVEQGKMLPPVPVRTTSRPKLVRQNKIEVDEGENKNVLKPHSSAVGSSKPKHEMQTFLSEPNSFEEGENVAFIATQSLDLQEEQCDTKETGQRRKSLKDFLPQALFKRFSTKKDLTKIVTGTAKRMSSPGSSRCSSTQLKRQRNVDMGDGDQQTCEIVEQSQTEQLGSIQLAQGSVDKLTDLAVKPDTKPLGQSDISPLKTLVDTEVSGGLPKLVITKGSQEDVNDGMEPTSPQRKDLLCVPQVDVRAQNTRDLFKKQTEITKLAGLSSIEANVGSDLIPMAATPPPIRQKSCLKQKSASWGNLTKLDDN